MDQLNQLQLPHRKIPMDQPPQQHISFAELARRHQEQEEQKSKLRSAQKPSGPQTSPQMFMSGAM